MKSYRTEIERLTPHLRQFARALVESHRPDVADDLVHDILAEATRYEEEWLADDIQVRLFSRLIATNRIRVQAGMSERRSLPGRPTSVEPKAARPGFDMSDPSGHAGHGLGSLSLADREALLLVVLERLDYPRAAEILGIPAGTLITRLAHARDHLGTSLWSSPAQGRVLPPAPRVVQARHLRLVK